MRHIHRSATAVVLVLVLAVPATAAASRTSSRSRGIMYAVKRFVVRVVSRISPPGGIAEPTPEDPTTTTTDAPPTTKSQ